MTYGFFGRPTISPGVSGGTSLSSSSKMRRSQYSSFTMPAALGLLSMPGGSQLHNDASVVPYAASNGLIPNRSIHFCATAGGMGTPAMKRSVVLASGFPESGASGRTASFAINVTMLPSVLAWVAPVRLISGQKLDTENFL